MSIVVQFTAFDKKLADQRWANFDETLEELKKKYTRMRELQEQSINKFELTEDELYNKVLAPQRAEKVKQREEARAEIDRIKEENPIFDTNFWYYLWDDTHFEKDDIETFITADLALGSLSDATFDWRDLKTPTNALAEMFPELEIEVDNSNLTPEQWQYVFLHKGELPARAIEHKEFLNDSVSSDDEFKEFTRYLGIFLRQLQPVVEKTLAQGKRLVIIDDAGGVEDAELIERAKVHIDSLCSMPKFKELFIS